VADQLTALLKPIADWFAGFNMPAPIVHWGHPLMMATVHRRTSRFSVARISSEMTASSGRGTMGVSVPS